MRRLVIAVSILAIPGAAWTEDESPAPETRPISYRARLDGTTAKIAVRYAIDVELGVDPDQQELPVPSRGIVTGAVLTVDGAVHRLTLDPAEQASAKFTTITDNPAGNNREWAVKLSTEMALPNTVHLEVAAPHPARLLIDLEIESPTCFFRDVRYATVPTSWQSRFGAAFVPHDDAAVDAHCESSGYAMSWIAFPSRDLAALPFGDQRIGALGSRLALDTQDIARVELDLSGELSHVPADLYTAIVIDGSRSVDPTQRTAQQEIVAAYLRAAPQSHVQIIEYDRKARALLPQWTTAAQAAAPVTRELVAMTARNGSNLDRGLAEAASWLARVDGTRRIVVFTDELFAQRLADIPAASLRLGLPDNTLVHVVALSGDVGALDRDNDALLEPLASATEGMAVFGRLDGDGKVDATRLVRPIALEQIAIQSPGWALNLSPTSDPCPFEDHGDLAEGTACSWWGLGTRSSGPVRIEGLLWGHHFVRVVRPDLSQARTLARVVSAIGADFDQEVIQQIDRAAFAVNAAWSLFGSWGGTDGYADLGRGGGGWGSSGCACGDTGTLGRTASVGTLRMLPPDELKAQLARGIDRRCSVADARFDVELELTLDEIVEVSVVMHGGSPTLHDCIEDAVWETALTLPSAGQHSTETVAFGE